MSPSTTLVTVPLASVGDAKAIVGRIATNNSKAEISFSLVMYPSSSKMTAGTHEKRFDAWLNLFGLDPVDGPVVSELLKLSTFFAITNEKPNGKYAN